MTWSGWVCVIAEFISFIVSDGPIFQEQVWKIEIYMNQWSTIKGIERVQRKNSCKIYVQGMIFKSCSFIKPMFERYNIQGFSFETIEKMFDFEFTSYFNELTLFNKIDHSVYLPMTPKFVSLFTSIGFITRNYTYT